VISVEQLERVRLIRLNRPPANLMTLDVLRRLREEAVSAGKDAGTRAVVVASDLPKYFSAGLDLSAGHSLELFSGLLEMYRAWLELPKPTVAAINGTAILGGWILSMAMDYRYMTPDGKIALSESRYGISPTKLLITRALELSGDPRTVKELVYRGRTLRAQEAYEARLVDELVPESELRERALKEARQLAKMAPRASASVKKALRRDISAIWQESLDDFRALYDSDEGREGLASLIEKRRPRWEA
jgi:enoyl-CoA hydratase/carnithine racemase